MKLALRLLSLSIAISLSCKAAALDFTGLTGSGAAIPNVQPSLAMTYAVRTSSSQYFSLGEIGLFAENFLPGGWTVADGRMLNIAANPNLYTALSATYGGNGSTTFALPDLRGRAAFGTGTGTGLTSRTLGANFGAEQVTLSNAQLPAHTHTLPQGGSTAAVGSGQSQPNVQPGLALNYALRTSGVFPPSGPGSPSDFGYLGQIDLFAGQSLLPDDVAANGSLLQASQNAALFSLLGTTFGGNGTTTFGVPDLRGRVAIHEGQGTGLTARSLGAATGSEQVVLTTSQMPAHSHTIPNSTTVLTGVTGGNALQPNMGPSLTVNYIIATSGTYPSQSTSDGTAIGQMHLFAGSFAPTGYAFADGQLLQIADYDSLFSLIGTTYGGDGQTTFALPDMRGRVPIDTGSGAGLTTRVLGIPAGAETVALTVANLPSHAHGVSIPGDLNFNGIVDAADYVTWRKSLGPQSDYNLWRTNFGKSSASGLSEEFDAEVVVPEPAATQLALIAMGLAIFRFAPRIRRPVCLAATAN